MRRFSLTFSYVAISFFCDSALAITPHEFNTPVDLQEALPSAVFHKNAKPGLLKKAGSNQDTQVEYSFVKKSTPQSQDQLRHNLLQRSSPSIKHERFTQVYQGLPVVGGEIISHTKNGKKTVTGIVYEGIHQDLPSVSPSLSVESAKFHASEKGSYSVSENNDTASLVIYVDDQNFAYLVYEVIHRGVENKQFVEMHSFVEAHTGEVLKSWNNTHHYHEQLEAQGGTSWRAYQMTSIERPNHYRFVKNPSQPYEFGPLEIEKISDQECYLQTKSEQGNAVGVSTYSVGNKDIDTAFDEYYDQYDEYPPFTYQVLASLQQASATSCASLLADHQITRPSFNESVELYLQQADAHYFATQTQAMFQEWYNTYPFNSRVFVFTNIDFANAFAMPSATSSEYPDQVWIGTGFDPELAELGSVSAGMASSSIVSHELGHLVTGHYSDLKYFGQSGGLNESFSDMTGIVFQDFLHKAYPWATYNYLIGGDTWISYPYYLRSMADPESDGYSISHFSQYKGSVEVHRSSGIFNKIFYNLAEEQHWGVRKAYYLMLTANMNYWDSGTTFERAACGMISAAYELGYDSPEEIQAVTVSFTAQGVTCSQS